MDWKRRRNTNETKASKVSIFMPFFFVFMVPSSEDPGSLLSVDAKLNVEKECVDSGRGRSSSGEGFRRLSSANMDGS